MSSRTCTGHRGRAGDPLSRARRTLHTGADLLTDRQHQRLSALFEEMTSAPCLNRPWWVGLGSLVSAVVTTGF